MGKRRMDALKTIKPQVVTRLCLFFILGPIGRWEDGKEGVGRLRQRESDRFETSLEERLPPSIRVRMT